MLSSVLGVIRAGARAMHFYPTLYYFVHDLETQRAIQLDEPQPNTAQNNLVKEEGRHPTYLKTVKGKKDDVEPKPTSHPTRTKLSRDDEVVLAIGESGFEAEEPMTVGQLFENVVKKFPARVALEYKENGIWKAITYSEYYHHCIRAAKSFLKVRVYESYIYC